MLKEAVIVSAVRTAIGNYGGTLCNTSAVKLGSLVIKEALRRAGLRPKRDPDILSLAPEAFKDAGQGVSFPLATARPRSRCTSMRSREAH